MMDIIFDSTAQVFHLHSGNTSYVIGLVGEGWLEHLYWGRALSEYRGSAPVLRYDRGFSPNPKPESIDRSFSLDTMPAEYPSAGSGDFRPPAVGSNSVKGGRFTQMCYRSHRIFSGKPQLAGLPTVYAQEDEAMTLALLLKDECTGLEAELYYTVFGEHNAICRSVCFLNRGQFVVELTNAASASLDLRCGGLELVTLWGAHANEMNLCRRHLTHGSHEFASIRGASSHQFPPFVALCSATADEESGDVYAMNLVYSGNHSTRVHLDQTGLARMTIGLDTADFSWRLEAGESLQTPEAVLVYSSAGFGAMSHTYHRLCREHLARGKFRFAQRPVLINNWEATYYNFNADQIYNIAKTSYQLGVELFVLDDGWFGKRDDDNSSLGDWVVDNDKLPDGLPALVEKITKLGMQFGLWLEPEMISVDSNLYRAHPDWCLHTPGRSSSFGRNQLVLDLSRIEVCEYIIEAISDVLGSSNITYVKWDMNRHQTENGSVVLPHDRQREVPHRYMLGLYHVLEELTTRFPDVLFESCSGGGGRFDMGMLHYMPQAWLSDDTDAICRLRIQHGASMVYPQVSMGSNVSVTPNHQVGRVTPLKTRGTVAMLGSFGYQLDITKLTEAEQQKIVEQISFYKKYRTVLQHGSLYRLISPFEGNEAAWCVVAPDSSCVVASYVKVLSMPNGPVTILRLKGLEPMAQYRDTETGKLFGGDELMYAGISVDNALQDFDSKMWVLEKIKWNVSFPPAKAF